MRKIQKTCPNFLRTAVLLFLFGQLIIFDVYKSFVYAEESVNSLMQDVVYAKQKREDLTKKVESIDRVMDTEKSKLLKEEADRLIAELSAQKESTTDQILKADVKVEPQKPAGNPGSSPETKSVSVPLKLKNIVLKDKPVKEPKIKPSRASDDRSIMAKEGFLNRIIPVWPYKDRDLTESEALYKVAVSDNKVTLKEAVDIGLANNLQIRAAKKRVEVADAKLLEAKRALFPTVQFELVENGGKVGGEVLNTDGSGGLVPGQRYFRGQSRKLNVNQPLFYGGELVFTVRQAEENLKSAKADYEKTRNEYIHNVRTSYYGVVKAEYNAQYQIDVYEKVSEVRKRIREEHVQKLISEVDYLKVESQYQQALFGAESSKNDLHSAEMVLRQTLDLDPSVKLPVDLKLNFTKVSAHFDELFQMALRYNPDLQLKAFNVESAKYGVKVYQAKKLPRVDLKGSYGYLAEAFKDTRTTAPSGDQIGQGEIDLEKEWFLGIQTSMPLGPNSVEYEQVKHKYGPTVLALTGSEDWRHRVSFNLFDKLSDITDEKSAQAAWLQAESDYDKAKQDLAIKLRDDFYNLEKYLIQVDSSIADVRYYDKHNTIQEYLSKIQELPVTEYLKDLIEETTAKYSFIQAITDYQIAVSSLGVSIGDPDYFER